MRVNLQKWQRPFWRDRSGKLGWVLLWALGVPIPVLIVLWMIRGGT